MAKGAESKEQILNTILKTFEGKSFTPDNKEVRIDLIENGEPVQIKVAITMVKVPLSNTPKIEVSNVDVQNFFLSEEDTKNLEDSLKELGVDF